MFLKEAVFSRTSIQAVAKSLDACTLRGRAIASNLANVTTPGYKRIEVAFESQLRDALSTRKIQGDKDQPDQLALGRPNLDQVHPVAYRSEDASLPGEINNVDVDQEASKMAENNLLFRFGVKFIQERKSSIESAINGNSQ